MGSPILNGLFSRRRAPHTRRAKAGARSSRPSASSACDAAPSRMAVAALNTCWAQRRDDQPRRGRHLAGRTRNGGAPRLRRREVSMWSRVG
eukprot:2164495-Prymnesium_polylepis.2